MYPMPAAVKLSQLFCHEFSQDPYLLRMYILAAVVACSGCSPRDDEVAVRDSEHAANESLVEGEVKPFYAVIPNMQAFPYPSEIPDLTDGNRRRFDWDRYIREGHSDADRAYRALLSPRELAYEVPGGTDSNTGDWQRFRFAAEEYEAKCDNLMRRYRAKLLDDEKNLKRIDQFDASRRHAITLHCELVGESWEGGSGERTAYANAAMKAYINYYNDLQAVGDSNFLQDLPE